MTPPPDPRAHEAPAPVRSPWAPARVSRHFRGGGGIEAHFRPWGCGGGGGARGRAGAPRDQRTHGRAAGSHGARPRGRGARAAAVSAEQGRARRRGATSVAPAAVWGAGPAREAGTARWDAPETPHSWGGRGPGCRTRGPGRASRASVPTPAEPCPRSFEFSDEGWAPTLRVTRSPHSGASAVRVVDCPRPQPPTTPHLTAPRPPDTRARRSIPWRSPASQTSPGRLCPFAGIFRPPGTPGWAPRSPLPLDLQVAARNTPQPLTRGVCPRPRTPPGRSPDSAAGLSGAA